MGEFSGAKNKGSNFIYSIPSKLFFGKLKCLVNQSGVIESWGQTKLGGIAEGEASLFRPQMRCGMPWGRKGGF